MSQVSVPRGSSLIPHRAGFAGALLMIAGVPNIPRGIAAIADDDIHVHIDNHFATVALWSLLGGHDGRATS
jgi:hypothetical protein